MGLQVSVDVARHWIESRQHPLLALQLQVWADVNAQVAYYLIVLDILRFHSPHVEGTGLQFNPLREEHFVEFIVAMLIVLKLIVQVDEALNAFQRISLLYDARA